MPINGTLLRGTAAYTTGKFSQALSAGVFDVSGVDAGFAPANSAPTDFTIEAWVKRGATGATGAFVGRIGMWWIGLTGGGGVVRAEIGGSTVVGLSGTTALNDGNTFHHVAVVRSGSSTSLYVDGNREATSTAATVMGSGSGEPAVIGGFGSNTGYEFVNGGGVIDEVRFSNVARYSGTTYTVPTTALNGDSNAAGLYHFDGNANDSAASGTPDTTAPTIPTNPAATAGNGSASVSFTASTDDVGVTSYRVYSSADSYTAAAATGTASPITVTGLTNGTAYTFKVSALDAAGNESARSATTSSVTPTAPVQAGTIPANDPNIVYSPYTWDVTSSRALAVNPGAYLRMLINGTPTAITLNFDVSSLDATYPSQIKWRLDRGPWNTTALAATVNLTLPTSNWPDRLLEVVVKSTSEAVNRWASPHPVAAKLQSVSVAPSTCVTRPIRAAALRGVVFGDSITEGSNTVSTSGDSTVKSDGTLSYVHALGQLLGAEVGQVGFGKQGISTGGNGSVPVVGSSWQNIAAGIARSFAAAPDFVVINEGTNDSGDITTGYMSLLNSMLATLPATTRLFAMRPLNGTHATEIQAAIAACTAPRRVTYIDTAGWFDSAVDSGDSVHPWGAANYAQIGPRLAAAIRTRFAAGATWTLTSAGAKRVSGVRI